MATATPMMWVARISPVISVCVRILGQLAVGRQAENTDPQSRAVESIGIAGVPPSLRLGSRPF